jgi:beta-lactamase class C
MRRATGALKAMSTAAFLSIATIVAPTGAHAYSDADIRAAVERQIQPLLDGTGGAAVAVYSDGRTLFYNFGEAREGRPVTSDALFNLASIGKVFVSTLLAQAVKQGEVALDDPVAKYVTELRQGGDIRRVTLGQLATHTSGLTSTPQQVETWHRGQYTLPDFIRYLNAWQADDGHQPGKQEIYSNAGFVLLWLALQRRFDTPIAAFQDKRLLRPLGMTSTALPVPGANSRGELAPALRQRAVQGYGPEGRPVGTPGNEQGTFNWPGTGQMYSSARDMAVFLAANLGALPNQRLLQQAMAFAQEGVFTVGPRFTQALGWGLVRNGDLTVVEKNGGLNNTSTYIGMIPEKQLGIVILMNRGRQPATRTGRQIMLALARGNAEVSEQGRNPD